MNLLYPTKVKYTTMQHDGIRQELTNALIVNPIFSDARSGKLGEINLLDLNIPEVDLWIQKEVYPAFDSYIKEIIGKSISDFSNYKFKAWITGVRGNYHLMLHNHSCSNISGTFYLLCEDQDQDGELVFCDPRGNANRGYNNDIWQQEFNYTRISPKTGDIYIFPSFLYHFVIPSSSKLRICVPVDLFLERD